MIRMLDIVMILALLAGAAWTFKVKNESEAALARVAELERRIAAEREAIDLLRADWSLLTSPDRLENLAEQFKDDLKIEQVKAGQIITDMDAVPQRPSLDAPPQEGTADGFAQARPADRKTITGSIPIE